MESPPTRIALGPFEVSYRKREGERRLGAVGSLVIHVIVIGVLLVVTPDRRAVDRDDVAPAPRPPVQITFTNPYTPPPQPPPANVKKTAPPPPARKPLRMESVPEITARARAVEPKNRGPAGEGDRRPAGGEPGGPIPEPTAGVPDPSPGGRESEAADSVARGVEPPKDLQGRLKEFSRAIASPEVSSDEGKKGSGSGTGGLTMPDVPATGFGIGNLEFEGRDYDWGDYGRSIYWAIWRAWHNRMLISAGNFERWGAEHRRWLIDARVRIVFTIESSGQVTGVATEYPSVCGPFDDAAAEALMEVVLPPLPKDFPRGSERVHATFIGEDMNLRSMRVGLSQMKQAGLF